MADLRKEVRSIGSGVVRFQPSPVGHAWRCSLADVPEPVSESITLQSGQKRRPKSVEEVMRLQEAWKIPSRVARRLGKQR